jgi:hypothetical protein
MSTSLLEERLEVQPYATIQLHDAFIEGALDAHVGGEISCKVTI